MKSPWHDLAKKTPDFSTYTQRWHDYILNKGYPKQISCLMREQNLPREWEPTDTRCSEVGILLIHGFNETAFGMLDIGNAAAKTGCRVRSIMLPGHGTHPAQLSKISAETWVETVKYGVRSLQEHCSKVILIGNSLGATLAINHALDQPTDVSALLLLAPALGVGSISTYLARWYSILKTPLRLTDWHRLRPEEDYARYCSTHYHSGLQSLSMMRQTRNKTRQQQLKPKTWIFLSKDDETINIRPALKFFDSLDDSQKELHFYGNGLEASPNSNTHNHPSAYPDEKILDFSHTCLQHTPNNPHYGREADYFDFQHAPDLKDTRPDYLGAISPHNIKKYKLARLHYNPDFARLEQTIAEIVAQQL